LGVIIPTDFHIFQRGRSTTKQMSSMASWTIPHPPSIFQWVSYVFPAAFIDGAFQRPAIFDSCSSSGERRELLDVTGGVHCLGSQLELQSKFPSSTLVRTESYDVNG
jgi:hypothetical protein